jgi:hypothetical protein
MVAVIKTYSISNKQLPIIDEMQKILGREGKRRGLSEWIINTMTDYVKTHASGNPIYPITKYFDPDFKPFPAFKENLNNTWIPYLKNTTDENIKDIIKQSTLISIYAKAYLTQKNRKMLNFGNIYTAEQAGQFIDGMNP